METLDMEREKTPLEMFREEMQQIKSIEQEKERAWRASDDKNGGAFDPHFNNINPDALTDMDRVIWEKVKNKTLTRKEIETYRATLKKNLEFDNPEEKQSRETFSEMVVNKAVFISQQELAAWQKQKGNKK
ncbi:MAG: hypothetical protein Q7S66_05775 [bacterium]|nr:hypothetical protein [bacterium]